MTDPDTIVECLLEPIFSVDVDENITFANARLSQVTQISRDRIIGSDIDFLKQFVSYSFNRLYRSIKSISAGRFDEQQVELEMRHPPSAPVPEQLTAQARIAPLHQDGERVGAVVVLRDMTVQRQQRERLHVLSRIFRHNVRNQINKMFALRKVADKLEDDQAQWVEIALEAASDISTTCEKYHLIEQKLTGKDKHYSRNLIQIVSSVAADVKEEYPEANINCAVGDSKCIEVTDGFTIAIEEIIVNAIEHNDCPEPQIKITTSESPGDPYLEIKIMDNGPGIEPEQAAIIEEAREVNQSTEHLNGLGLWAARWVIENCEGSLSFEANNPRGTVVTLRVPHCEQLNGVPQAEDNQYQGPPT